MHLFKVTLGQILNNFPLFTCHFFPPVFKEVLVKDVFAGVVMIKHLCIKWCHLKNNTLSNSGSLSVFLVSTTITGPMSKKYTLTHYMAESTSRQDEANPVLIGLIDQACSVKKTGSIFYIIIVNLGSRTRQQLKKRQILCDKRDTNFVWKKFASNFIFL